MIQLSSPTRVTPTSCTVPRLKVQNSRIVFAVANLETGRLTSVLLVLRHFAEGAKLENPVVATDLRMSLDDCVRPDLGVVTNLDVGTDDGVGADLDIGTNPGTRIDNSGRCESF